MALEIIRGEAIRIAQGWIDDRARKNEERRLREEEISHQRSLAEARTINEHQSRFQPLQNMLDYFGTAIQAVRQEYFPDSAVFIIDHYKEPNNYFRALTLINDTEFFTVFAIARQIGEKTSYSLAIEDGLPDFDPHRGYSEFEREKTKKVIEGLIPSAKAGETVILTPPDSLFELSHTREGIFVAHFNNEETPLPLNFYPYEPSKPIPFDISQETTDTVLKRMGQLLAHKEEARLTRPQDQAGTTSAA